MAENRVTQVVDVTVIAIGILRDIPNGVIRLTSFFFGAIQGMRNDKKRAPPFDLYLGC